MVAKQHVLAFILQCIVRTSCSFMQSTESKRGSLQNYTIQWGGINFASHTLHLLLANSIYSPADLIKSSDVQQGLHDCELFVVCKIIGASIFTTHDEYGSPTGKRYLHGSSKLMFIKIKPKNFQTIQFERSQ